MRTLMLSSILFLLSLGVASAQIVSPVIFNMNTQFIVGSTTFPAGSYEILPTDDQSLLEIRGPKGAAAAFFEVEPLVTNTPFKQTELVFNQYGGEHMVLKEVMVAGETLGATTVTSNAEKRHRKDHGKPTRVRQPAKKK